MSTRPLPAEIEIIERLHPGAEPPTRAELIVPNEVRINGTPLLVSRDRPITIHEIDIDDGSVVQVTLTLFARRVRIDIEPADQAVDRD